jgi:hypothetical protein
MPELRQEICRGTADFRAWNNQGRLSEVQKRQGEAEHLRRYDQDQPEELKANRSSLLLLASTNAGKFLPGGA